MVHGNQHGRGNSVERQTERIDQEHVFLFGNAGRYMGGQHVVPAMHCDQPITGRQIDTDLPFGFRMEWLVAMCIDDVHCTPSSIRATCTSRCPVNGLRPGKVWTLSIKIGRASVGERVWQDVVVSGVAVTFKKKKNN